MDNSEQQLKKDEQFMRRALDEAMAAREAGEIPVGAVIVAADRIIARAHNLTETLGDVTAHAEMQAITSAIGWSQIRRVVFGAADEKRGFMRFAPKALHPKCTVTQGVLEEDCRTLMTDFFRSRR